MTGASADESESSGAGTGGPNEEFVRLFTTVQRPLYMTILPMVHSPADAEEVLQEANVVILSKWAQFHAGTNFLAWASANTNQEIIQFNKNIFKNFNLIDDYLFDLF